MRALNLELLLPSDLHPGERVLWHGRPQWISMARRAFRADFVAAYFAVMTVLNIALTKASADWQAAAISGAETIAAGLASIAILALLAFLCSRTTLYVVTTKRVVMRIGIALPVFFNLPFSSIVSAALRAYDDGTGDLPLTLEAKTHIAYLHLWPHAKPFKVNHPEPSLRCVPDAAKVAEILSRALIAASNEVNSVSAANPKAMPARTEDLEAYPHGAVAA